MNSDKPRTNEHGAEVFSGSIFNWNEIDRVRFDEDRAEAQLITGEHMHLIRAVYEPGATYPMHSHPHEQFSLMLSGRMLLTVGDYTREIGPGDGWYYKTCPRTHICVDEKFDFNSVGANPCTDLEFNVGSPADRPCGPGNITTY